jgi:cysteine desulfurase/selenocysteine lyase
MVARVEMGDLAQFRADFPMINDSLLYFDTAATAQKPRQVIDAMNHFYSSEYGTVNRAVYSLAKKATDRFYGVRNQVAKFIGAESPNEIVFTKGTTEAINLVARSFGRQFVKPGMQIIIGTTEHHANIVPWQVACRDFGADLQVVPVDANGEWDLVAYQTLLERPTALVAVAHYTNSIGVRNPIEQIISMAHAAGARVLVDGAQGIGEERVRVQAMGADFYVFSGHKLYGPTGVGVLYGRVELLEAMPPYQLGGDMIDRVTFEKTTYQMPPHRFEAGTPMIAEVIGLGAAIEYLESVGMDQIHTWKRALSDYARDQLRQIKGITILGDGAKSLGTVISFTIKGIHPLDLGTLLDMRGVAIRTGHHCAQPTMARFGIESAGRISFGLYNTKDEIDRLVNAILKVADLLR